MVRMTLFFHCQIHPCSRSSRGMRSDTVKRHAILGVPLAKVSRWSNQFLDTRIVYFLKLLLLMTCNFFTIIYTYLLSSGNELSGGSSDDESDESPQFAEASVVRRKRSSTEPQTAEQGGIIMDHTAGEIISTSVHRRSRVPEKPNCSISLWLVALSFRWLLCRPMQSRVFEVVITL